MNRCVVINCEHVSRETQQAFWWQTIYGLAWQRLGSLKVGRA